MAAVDRDAILKKAEKLLRQGKIDGAIEEYVRLVEAQPRDWNTINALGDLYMRAGDADRAVAQYTRVADHLFQEGFFPKAAALYKKALKVKSDDEHTLLQLGEIAIKQGLLADSKLYFRQLAAQRKLRGDARGAAECLIRLGTLDEADAESRIAAARAAQQLGDTKQAATLLKKAANDFEKAKRHPEALDLLVDAAQLDPSDIGLRTRLARECVKAGNLDRARIFLTAESAGDDPDLLLALGSIELASGKDGRGRTVFTRLMMIDSGYRDAVMELAMERARAGHVDSAFGCVEVVADNALISGEPERAVAVLQTFVAEAPAHVPALQKLVELCVDAGVEGPLRAAQGQLADAHLAAGNGAAARFIAEDLLDRDPSVEANVTRLRRALELLGVANPDEVIEERLRSASPVLGTANVRDAAGPVDAESDLPIEIHFDASIDTADSGIHLPFATGPTSMAEPTPPPSVSPPPAPAWPPEDVEDETVEIGSIEIDLSEMLAELGGTVAPSPPPPPPTQAKPVEPPPDPGPPPDLETVFEDLRNRIARGPERTEADAKYDRALEHIRAGRLEDAIADLQAAARVPPLRFPAAAQLGRLYIGRGELKPGVDWLERAAEAPAPTANEGFALLYDLADALERMGETARALAILMELETDANDYRDIRTRIDRLSRVQAGSHHG